MNLRDGWRGAWETGREVIPGPLTFLVCPRGAVSLAEASTIPYRSDSSLSSSANKGAVY